MTSHNSRRSCTILQQLTSGINYLNHPRYPKENHNGRVDPVSVSIVLEHQVKLHVFMETSVHEVETSHDEVLAAPIAVHNSSTALERGHGRKPSKLQLNCTHLCMLGGVRTRRAPMPPKIAFSLGDLLLAHFTTLTMGSRTFPSLSSFLSS